MTVAWGGEEVGGGGWLGLSEWVGWRVGEMVGRRGVGVCNTQPQPRYYIALVAPASASAMAPASATAICLDTASYSLCILPTRVIVKKDSQRKRHETYQETGGQNLRMQILSD